MLDPLIECEFFVTLARDLPPRAEPWTPSETIEAIAEVHAGIEVAECRYPRKALPPLPGILADGSASGRYVFGDRIESWREGLASIPVRLEIDGALRREGIGADVMGDPLRPLWWLAEQRRQWGDGLRAGETISTGSMTGMLPIRAASTFWRGSAMWRPSRSRSIPDRGKHEFSLTDRRQRGGRRRQETGCDVKRILWASTPE